MNRAVVGCLRYLPNKPGQRCGRHVDDGELMMCAEHARYHRNRLRLDELIAYGGHHLRREWRTNAGDLRDDWYFYVSEHTQIPEPRHSILERHLREEIDACNAAPFARCTAYRGDKRSEIDESTEPHARAVSEESTVPSERAVMDESTAPSDRAVGEESTVSTERPINWDRFRLSRDDYSHT